jgi:hypothetical protein
MLQSANKGSRALRFHRFESQLVISVHEKTSTACHGCLSQAFDRLLLFSDFAKACL